MKKIGCILDAFRARWMLQFESLKQYRVVHSNAWPVADEQYPEGNRLGAWLAKQRECFRNGTLEPWKHELLNSIDVMWNPLQDEWSKQFNALQKHRVLYPSEWPSVKSLEHKELGVWCSIQRQAFKKGKLSSEKIVSLEA